MRVLLSLIFAVVFTVAYSEKFSYTGYREVRVFPQTDKHLAQLAELENIDTELDFWTDVKRINDPVVILISPKKFAEFSAFANSNNIPFTVVVENFQDIIDEEARSMRDNSKRQDNSILFRYSRFNEIQNYLLDVVQANPTFASIYNIGVSVQGRNLNVITLGSDTGKYIWIDAGIHAREWASVSTAVYIIDTLVKEYKANDSITTSLFSKYQFHILPVVNPDGYEYCHTSTRLWRKNRSTNSNSSCAGVDLNRNFPFQWMVGGASNNTCSDTYAGPIPNSEPEAVAIMNAINAKIGNWVTFITLHTYGQLWLTPWGYSATNPSDYWEMRSQAQIGADALKAVNGITYTLGSSYEILYQSSGSSRDWAKGAANIKWSYTLELRPAQTGTDSQYGFTLPEDRMPYVAPETYAGLKSLFNSL